MSVRMSGIVSPVWRPGVVFGLLAGVIALSQDTELERELASDVIFANASFEEDVENDGIPDHWDIPDSTSVQLTQSATHGVKAPHFTDGYVLAAQDFHIRNLAGRQLVITVDVKGSDNAALGCLAACFRRMDDNPRRFVYSRLAWDRDLADTYETLTMRYRFPENCLDGRLWIAFYRSNREGTVWLDHVRARAQALSAEQTLTLTRLAREFAYLAERARKAAAMHENQRDTFAGIAVDAERIAGQCRDALPGVLAQQEALTEDLTERHATINRAFGDGPFLAMWSPPCERLSPAPVIPVASDAPHVEALLGEHLALGVLLCSTVSDAQDLQIEVSLGNALKGPPTVRRQVFMETWYTKGKTRIADPLPRLPQRDDRWLFTLPGGGLTKLYIGFRATDRPPVKDGTATIRVIGANTPPRVLTCQVDVLPVTFPHTPRLEHLQFIYPDKQPAASHPEVVARDMAEHAVTAMEFPYLPDVAFSAEGALVEADFERSVQARWMRAYGRHIERLAIFWEGRYRRFPIAGQPESYLPVMTEDGAFTAEFLRAYRELLSAWLAFAERNGFGPERFLMLPDDEPSSGKAYAEAPGPAVRRACHLYELTRETAPEVPIAVTLTDYAGPADAAAVAESVDVVLPVWPYREKLSRWAPPGYSPREAFFSTILPHLASLRQSRGLSIWSYRVDRGKSEDVLISARAYPAIAVGAGFTGIATWAYNVTRGSSWDDTDGGLLDYIFVYDGTEDHPLNAAVNPTRETVVPSIRWEAMRLGWQDGQILLHLKAWAEATPEAAEAAQIGHLLATCRQWAEVPSAATFEGMRAMSTQLRRLMVATTSRNGVR